MPTLTLLLHHHGESPDKTEACRIKVREDERDYMQLHSFNRELPDHKLPPARLGFYDHDLLLSDRAKRPMGGGVWNWAK